jgi:hypothetical protein
MHQKDILVDKIISITSPFFNQVTLGSGSPLTMHASFSASPSLIVISLNGFTNFGWHISASEGGTIINKREVMMRTSQKSKHQDSHILNLLLLCENEKLRSLRKLSAAV